MSFVPCDRETDYLLPPSVNDWLPALLVYGYAAGVFSSRPLERSTYDSVAFRYLAANTHPDHDTIANFRKRFLPELESLFVQTLLLARGMKLLKLGKISLDGTITSSSGHLRIEAARSVASYAANATTVVIVPRHSHRVLVVGLRSS